MKLAHTGDNRLSRLPVVIHLKGGVFLGQPAQGILHLILVSLGFGFNGDRQHRLWKTDGFKEHGLRVMAQGVTGKSIFHSQAGDNGSGVSFRHLFAPVGMHDQDSADALSLSLGRIIYFSPCLHLAGIHPEIDQPSHKGVRDNLESQRGEGGIILGGAHDFGFFPDVNGFNRG